MIRILLLLAGLMTGFFVSAGPPENATKHMIPFPSICTPTLTEMMTALTIDYAVHVSASFDESPYSHIMVVINPETYVAGVLHITRERSCLIFSGQNLKLMARPDGMAPPMQEVPNSFDTES